MDVSILRLKGLSVVDPAPLDKVLVIIPTYNELENIELITSRLRRAVPQAHILIADDNSPDGTGDVADRLAEADDHIHVMHRQGKQGLGAAYIAGFRWGLDRGYDVLVEHDADGSHQPEQLPLLLDALKHADMVKGSRYVAGGSVVNWPKSRELLSRGGSLWTRLMLGIPVKDITGGFNAFRAATLPSSTRSRASATTSRSTSRGRPCSRGSRSPRCRSSSWSGSAASRR